MDADKLPTEHDVIVLGTGMTESIVAAALSRVGLRVLHLDRSDNYGGDWGAFNFIALKQWIAAVKDRTDRSEKSSDPRDLSSYLSADEKLFLLPAEPSTISNLEESIHIPGKAEPKEDGDVDAAASPPLNADDEIVNSADSVKREINQSEIVQEAAEDACVNVAAAEQDSQVKQNDASEEAAAGEEKIKKEALADAAPSLDFAEITKKWRKFSIDLMPKVLYNRGPLAELLISSNVAKYCEFRCITRVLTLLKGKLELVPCSRADVFASHDVSVIEKRLLMKFLTFAIEYQKHPTQYEGFEERPFVEFLKSKRLTETVQHYIHHAIAMVTDATSTMEGLEATQKFLLSLGRYGNTAFLWPLYGSGELLQCFCRMCAVFGGIYCLRRSAQGIILNSSNEVCGIIDTEGQRLQTKWLIMEASYASEQFLPQIESFGLLSRGILITDRSVKPHKEQQMTVMSLPLPGRDDSRVTIFELSSLSETCPKDFYVVHLTCRSLAQTAKADLQPIVDLLFQPPEQEVENDDRPQIIWSLYFNMADSNRSDLACKDMENVFVVDGPDFALDCDQSITVAKRIFAKICPDEEFLPAAPNPEDIIFDDGETSQSRESGFETIPEDSTETDVSENTTETAESSEAEITCSEFSDAVVIAGDSASSLVDANSISTDSKSNEPGSV